MAADPYVAASQGLPAYMMDNLASKTLWNLGRGNGAGRLGNTGEISDPDLHCFFARWTVAAFRLMNREKRRIPDD